MIGQKVDENVKERSTKIPLVASTSNYSVRRPIETLWRHGNVTKATFARTQKFLTSFPVLFIAVHLIVGAIIGCGAKALKRWCHSVCDKRLLITRYLVALPRLRSVVIWPCALSWKGFLLLPYLFTI